MKNLAFLIITIFIFSACSKRAQCPAYMKMSEGTISVQEGATPEEIQEQSRKLLETQGSYIAVERDKKTGLVKSKKRVKKGKNNAMTHKGFANDPRTLKGVK